MVNQVGLTGFSIGMQGLDDKETSEAERGLEHLSIPMKLVQYHPE